MYAVWLKSFPKDDKHTFERIVRKQQRKAEDASILGALDGVISGTEYCIRAFEEEETAENLVKELSIYSGKAEVREGGE
jgi:hypothetical protein